MIVSRLPTGKVSRGLGWVITFTIAALRATELCPINSLGTIGTPQRHWVPVSGGFRFGVVS